ncbi:MAG TPA: hypothetical protein VK399_12720 [Longimicrobiaceae bacterium]|jgi:hypothetical protein|nr:hypothetical protein [Longimicrobiaceae bacterium]
MSHAEERSTYRAPSTTVVGKVEELTRGGTDGGYSDGFGGWYGLAFTADDDAQDSRPEGSDDETRSTGAAAPQEEDEEE